MTSCKGGLSKILELGIIQFKSNFLTFKQETGVKIETFLPIFKLDVFVIEKIKSPKFNCFPSSDFKFHSCSEYTRGAQNRKNYILHFSERITKESIPVQLGFRSPGLPQATYSLRPEKPKLFSSFSFHILG